MKRELKSMSISSLFSKLKRGKIDLRPKFQRGAVWGKAQKRQLVDSIMNDMDIPKIYFREVSRDSVEHEVVDGQQRLQAIEDFCKNKFKTESTEIKGKKIPSLTYSELEDKYDDLWEHFNGYEFSVVILRDAKNDDVEDMFLRLQNGTPLNAPEKRNAMPGNMRDFIKELSVHQFFQQCGFKDHRYAFAHITSQMVCLEIGDGSDRACSIRKPELDNMYKNRQDFDVRSSHAQNVKSILNILLKAFPEKTPELEKHNAISMFLLFRYLRKNFVITGRESEIGEWFIQFERERKEDNKKSADDRESEMIEYQDKTGNSTDSPDSLNYRQKFIRPRLLGKIVDLMPLDKQRAFTEEQRVAIWRRDNGVCQIAQQCKGEKIEWDGRWHADHKKPWSQGGETTVENGQVACAACNLAKGGGD